MDLIGKGWLIGQGNQDGSHHFIGIRFFINFSKFNAFFVSEAAGTRIFSPDFLKFKNVVITSS